MPGAESLSPVGQCRTDLQRLKREKLSVEIPSVYVKDDNKAVLVCPHCGFSKTVDAGRCKKSAGPLKIKCTCGSTFEVFIEFRGAHRKETDLVGHYCKLPHCEEWGEMVVKNISSTGLGFKTLGPHHIRAGDRIRVKFRLDDAKKSEIDKDIIAREVKDTYVGCSFSGPLEFDQVDSALGFYLMP